MKKRGIIIAGGNVSEKDAIKKYITEKSMVICADSGYLSAVAQAVKVDALIGDFDSLAEMNETVPKGEFEVITYNSEKDQSDTQLCIDYLLNKGIEEIYIFGGLGGKRFDHAFANVQLLEYGLEKGIDVFIISENTKLFVIRDNCCDVFGDVGDYLSVFALTDAKNVTYRGLKYMMTNGELRRNTPLGLSNVLTEKKATVSVGNGTLLIIHTGGEHIEGQ